MDMTQIFLSLNFVVSSISLALALLILHKLGNLKEVKVFTESQKERNAFDARFVAKEKLKPIVMDEAKAFQLEQEDIAARKPSRF